MRDTGVFVATGDQAGLLLLPALFQPLAVSIDYSSEILCFNPLQFLNMLQDRLPLLFEPGIRLGCAGLHQTPAILFAL